MKKKLIWNVRNYENKNEGLLIDPEDVEEVCNFCDYSVATIDLPVSEKKKLNKLLEEKEAEIYDYCDLEDFLEENGYQNVEIDSLEDYPVCEEKLCFDFQEKEFFDLAECYTERIYRYWNGSNWKTVFCDNETEIVISDDYVNLDEWDGRNFVTGGVGLHERIYRVYEVDGEKVDNAYMVLYSSQWQGDHDLAEVMDLEKLQEHLKEIDRDLDEYIPQILAIK